MEITRQVTRYQRQRQTKGGKGQKAADDCPQPRDTVITLLPVPPQEQRGQFLHCEWNAIYRQLCKGKSWRWRRALAPPLGLMIGLRLRNGLRAFHHNPYSAHIDLPVYFHTVMDGIVPPSPLLVQIITDRYVLKAPHQNIILTHDLFPPMPRRPSTCAGVNGVPFCERLLYRPARSIEAIS